MVIIKAKKIIRNGDTKRRIRFAWYPVRMQKDSTDKNGEVIWWERFEELYCAVSRPADSNEDPWILMSRIRIAVLMLDKLEK